MPENTRHVQRAHELFAGEIARAGIGEAQFPDAPYHVPGSHHHMGGARLSNDPQHGIVDADCRVYGMAGLYVASSAVFPTGGYANPTLTIVALAIRLADHLKAAMGVSVNAAPMADGA